MFQRRRIKKLIFLVFLIALQNIPCTCSAEISKNIIAKKLNWQPADNLCRGVYIEPKNVASFSTPPNEIGESETTIQSDYPILLQKNGWSQFKYVTIMQPGRTITADKARAYRNAETGGITSLILDGNVHFFEPGKHLVSDRADFNMAKKTGSLKSNFYRIYTKTPTGLHNAQGQAQIIERPDENTLIIKHGTYTTCSPVNRIWHMKASNIHIDRTKNRGFARHMQLYVRNIPILYLPFFSFPIDKKRKSGFLTPLPSFSKTLGSSIGLPYYFNLAPNYDATITTFFTTKRGLIFKNLFRYLTKKSHGDIKLDVLPNDRRFSHFKQTASASDFQGNNRAYINQAVSDLRHSSSTRTLTHWHDHTQWNKNWSSTTELNHVSDSYYFQDVEGFSTTSDRDQLLNRFITEYKDTHWHFSTLLQAYQTLHPANEGVVMEQYRHLPQLNLGGHYFDPKTSLDYEINTEFVHFSRAPLFGTPIRLPTGNRAHAQPSITWQKLFPSGYFKPTLQLAMTSYDLNNQTVGLPNHINRSLPIFNIDTGLYFEQPLHLGGATFLQTLEPRLFYLYAPNRNQNNIPLFDTTLPSFSFNQLFRTNRFSGLDRINDANQITLALTSRILDSETGEERLHLGLGQIYYLSTYQVCLTPTCAGDPTLGQHYSPLVGQLIYQLSKHFSAQADASWDIKQKHTQNAELSLSYLPYPDTRINVGYSFVRTPDPLQQSKRIRLSTVFPLKNHWNFVGSWYYDMQINHPQSYLYGLEYDSCCLATRLLASRELISKGQNQTQLKYDQRFYIQIQLKGLGNIGQDQANTLLKSNVSGYNSKIFD